MTSGFGTEDTMRARTLLLLITVSAALLGGALLAQAKPDLSGTWTLIDVSGASGRDGGPAKPKMISGAVINCGTECTFDQSDATIKISFPVDLNGIKPAETLLKLDGTEMPGNATAKWEAGKLVVTRVIVGSMKVVQTLSIADQKLIIVNVFTAGDLPPTTFTYRKKK